MEKEMDMRIKKDGIPIAIYEGLIHRDRKYLYDHIKKATGRYNLSGCRTVYIVEFFREKGFGTYWDNTLESLDDYEGLDGAEEDSGLNLVKMYCGRIVCDGGYMSFILFGVNAPKHLEEENIRLA